MRRFKYFTVLLLGSIVSIKIFAADFVITDFGAVGDGKTICTEAIQQAIDESVASNGRVVIPVGDFVTGTLFLRNNTTLFLEKNANLLGSSELSDYPHTEINFRFWGDTWVYHSLIIAHYVNNVTIEGQGTIDGRGGAFPVTAKRKPDRYRNRPYLLWFAECKHVVIRDVELRNSAMWMQSYIRCDDLKIDGIKVFNHCNKNNDLMDIDGCRDVVITRVVGDADDDGITFKSTTDRLAENITVSDCIISSHCNALKFGTETTTGFRNVTISNCVIRESAVPGVRAGFPEGISGISLEIVDGGILENVAISNIVIDGPRVPLFVRLGNRARKYYAGASAPSVGSIKNVTLTNIVARASSSIGCSFVGVPDGEINGITLSDSRFVFPGGVTNIPGDKAVKEFSDHYPEATMFGTLPACGLYMRHVNNVNIQNVSLEVLKPDVRPAILCDDVNGGEISHVSLIGNKSKGSKVRVLKNSDILVKSH